MSVSVTHENMEKLTRLEDIQRAYDTLCKEEEEVSEELSSSMSNQVDLADQMASLTAKLPNLNLIYEDSKQLSGMITFTSKLAENVSSKVRQLELAKSRVDDCMQRVKDILALKLCTDGVQTALHEEDYEQAAAHIHKFLLLDEKVLRMSADASEGSTLDTSFKLLHESKNKVKQVVHKKFDAAVHAGDVASVQRFLKVFAWIGEHEAGLNKFSKYLCSQLSETADNNLQQALATDPQDKRANVLYADTLTLLFEGIARVVEIHQPFIETYYGPGKLQVMVESLQRECDRQARKILERFKENREIDRKAQQVHQALMYSKSATSEKLDPKELDVVLTEITLLNTRAELYLRFVRRRVVNDLENLTMTDEVREERMKSIEKFVTTCELSKSMQELIGNYIMMEEYFMREMILKAVTMDNLEQGSLTSSMVDDTFFIVKKCVRRAMSSSSVDGVCAMLNHACGILEQDFREVLYSRLRQGFPSEYGLSKAYNLVQSSFQYGKIYTDPETNKAKSAFLTTLNNAEVSCDYIQTLRASLEEEVNKVYGHMNDQSKAKLQSCLSDMGAISGRFKDVIEFGFSQLQSSVIKPRIKPWIDNFVSCSHNITEDDFANYEANDPWVQQFIVDLDNMLATFKGSLTSMNYDGMVSHITTEVTTRLEKAVYKTTFNRLGGLQFDKELRALVGYLTSATTWTIRDKFARLTQMATILNLETVGEIMDYWGPNSGPLTWRLTPAEVRQVLSLRIDFRTEDIKRLKL